MSGPHPGFAMLVSRGWRLPFEGPPTPSAADLLRNSQQKQGRNRDGRLTVPPQAFPLWPGVPQCRSRSAERLCSAFLTFSPFRLTGTTFSCWQSHTPCGGRFIGSPAQDEAPLRSAGDSRRAGDYRKPVIRTTSWVVEPRMKASCLPSGDQAKPGPEIQSEVK